MDSVAQDIRFAFRTWRRNVGFASVAVLILGLGVGAATAIFGVVNAVLLKPLPYAEPSRLVAVTRVFRPETQNRVVETVALNELRDWREKSESFESMSALFFTRTPVLVGDAAYLPNTVYMDHELLRTLGTQPAIGTSFDGVRDVDTTVIISHDFWQRAFDGAADVIGREIVVQNWPHTVRAVLPEGFEVPRTDARFYRGPVDVFMPALRSFRGGNDWGVARLAVGVSLDRAQAELGAVVAASSESANGDWSARLTPLAEERTRASRQPLIIFFAIGAVLLVIACTNLANLLLARSAARAQELAIREAVGATPGRLLRQHVTESLCLAAVGGALGIAIAAVGVGVIEAMSPLRLPIVQGITLDARVLGFGSAISIGTALVAGAVPALSSVLSGYGAGRPRTGATARVFPRAQKTLTVVQIGLSVGLLAAAGVLSHSLWRLNTVERGFVSERVLGFQLTVPGSRDEWIQGTFVDRALDEIASIAGVASVGYITFLPPETWAGYFAPFRIEGPLPEDSSPRPMTANTLTTSADYFATVGMTLIEGRGFDATDDADSPPVMIVNEAFADAWLRGETPVGRRVFSEFDTRLGREDTAREIVGVVNDTRDRGLDQRPLPTIYLPYRQGTISYGAIAVRAEIAPGALTSEIRRRLRRVDPDVPVTDFETLDERIRESLRQPRFFAFLAAICAGLAVLFVSVGLYGVVAYSVSRRTVEFGVRMALGSSQGRILGLVLGQGAALALVGAGLGLLLAFASMRGFASLLFEVEPFDPPTLVGAVVVVLAVALLATFVPARRACRLSPMTALRHD